MDRQIVIQNLLANYGKHGITKEFIEPLIDSGRKEGLTYDLIYLGLDAELSKRFGEEFYCTSSDMARAFGVSEDEVNQMIEEARQELIEAGENPDDYFRETQVQTLGFMV